MVRSGRAGGPVDLGKCKLGVWKGFGDNEKKVVRKFGGREK